MTTAEKHLLNLLNALPKSEYWTPKLIAAERAARWFLDSRTKRKVKK